MRFERGLRSAGLKPYPSGYEAVATDDVNPQTPLCQFGGQKDPGLWLVQQEFPATLELGVTLTPLWAVNESASAIIDKSNRTSIYPPRRIFSKVRVEITGNGNYQLASGDEKTPFVGECFLNYQLEVPKPYLYQKAFLMQPEGKQIRWASSAKASEETPVLWAYGAQQTGDDIHPFVFTLESVRQETCLRESSLLSWRERGIYPPIAGRAAPALSIFQDVFEEDQTRTLLESIEAGMSVIWLKVGKDETGGSEKIPYYSYRFMKNFILYKRGV